MTQYLVINLLSAFIVSGCRTLRYVYIRDSCITCICISYLRANTVVGSLTVSQGTRLRMSAFPARNQLEPDLCC